jgi:hypothetical protein
VVKVLKVAGSIPAGVIEISHHHHHHDHVPEGLGMFPVP